MESLTKQHLLNIHSLDQSMWMRTEFFAPCGNFIIIFQYCLRAVKQSKEIATQHMGNILVSFWLLTLF